MLVHVSTLQIHLTDRREVYRKPTASQSTILAVLYGQEVLDLTSSASISLRKELCANIGEQMLVNLVTILMQNDQNSV